LGAAAFVFAAAGCDAKLDAQLYRGGKAEIAISAGLGDVCTALVKRLTGGDVPARSQLDAAVLSENFNAVNGVASARFTQKTQGAVEGRLVVSSFAEIFAFAGGNAVVWEESAAGGSFSVTLDRRHTQEFITNISAELAGYLSTIMAPIATGEELTKSEYLDEVTAIWGKPLADEISESRFVLSLTAPTPIRSAQGGNRSGRTAYFDIPLVDLLVLESPLVYKISW
jgi:hypothetical protein